MAAPTIAEAPIYAGDVKRSRARVIVGVDPPYWTQEQQDTFAAGPMANVAWASSWINGAPEIVDNKAVIKSYGVPLFEWFRARETYAWLPLSPVQPFVMEFPFDFPTADPVYSVPIKVPGANNDLGDLDDPLLIYQLGSAIPDATQGALGTGDEGNIIVVANGAEIINIPHDTTERTARIEWDPLKQVNSFIFTVKIDGSIEYESDTASWPRHPQFSDVWDPLHEWDGVVVDNPVLIPAPGTALSPVTVLRIGNFKTTQLGSLGYELPEPPDFAFDSSGDAGNHDDPEDGEIHTVDLTRWVKIPSSYILNITGDAGVDVQMNKATVVLDPEQATNLALFPWNNRPVLIDFLEEAPDGSQTEWHRKMAGRVSRAYGTINEGQRQYILEINSEIEDTLNINITIAFRGDAAPADNPVLIGGMNVDDVINYCIDLADALKGSGVYLSTGTDRQIRLLDITVSDAGTLGSSLLQFIGAIIQSCGYEYVVHYTTSGTGRYGIIKVHAVTLGNGTADYVIPEGDILSFQPDEGRDNGPGQVNLRQSFPDVAEDSLLSTFLQPTPGMFPTVVYPITGKVLTDSISFVKELQATGLQALKDKDDNTINGGIAAHRYRALSAERRSATVNIDGREHIEPTDEIELDVPGWVLPNETWIVKRESWRFQNNQFSSTYHCVTTDWHQALRRSL